MRTLHITTTNAQLARIVELLRDLSDTRIVINEQAENGSGKEEKDPFFAAWEAHVAEQDRAWEVGEYTFEEYMEQANRFYDEFL